jgi:uncharacterized protein
MNSFGIDEPVLAILRQVFAQYPEIQQVKLYGLRAKGTHRPNSDLDLVLMGKLVDRFTLANILMDLDDSDMPLLVDLQNYSEIKNRQLLEHIDRVGLVIYERDQTIADTVEASAIYLACQQAKQENEFLTDDEAKDFISCLPQ